MGGAEGARHETMAKEPLGAAHPLADHLRLTVRGPGENDRLADAAAAITPTLPAIEDAPEARS